MNRLLSALGEHLGRFLSQRRHAHSVSLPTPSDLLLNTLRPADILLVEGDTRISAAIKYLTQSTWSHAALFVGSLGKGRFPEPSHCFVEADLLEGVRSIGIESFNGLHTRICRPVALSQEEDRAVVEFAIACIGHRYDLRNVVDLARYLLPTPPVPTQLRRRMIALGSGDPTRAICSTLIAQAFQSIGYPVLPDVEYLPNPTVDCPECLKEVLRVRHHSLFTPRDFDVSPYFQIVKPSIREGFDFRAIEWNARDDRLV
jgi:hypothetical protein